LPINKKNKYLTAKFYILKGENDMKSAKKIFKEHVNFYVNEDNKTVTAVCENVYMPLSKIYRHITQGKLAIFVKTKENMKITETAKCSPEDIFNEEIGKTIALNKLYRNKFKSILNNEVILALKSLKNTYNSLAELVDRPNVVEDKGSYDVFWDLY
jgi:hypothetical protein